MQPHSESAAARPATRMGRSQRRFLSWGSPCAARPLHSTGAQGTRHEPKFVAARLLGRPAGAQVDRRTGFARPRDGPGPARY
ncbi:hypothetical protein IMZ48_35375 [Candidatus Bathyarchaeota archaeon]|nr:hypothetical protein [Candidatus Bathyarchaeota archaeon]